MRDDETRIADQILRNGSIVRDEEFSIGDKAYRQYTIEIDLEAYDLTKCNGEWVYIHRHIKGGRT